MSLTTWQTRLPSPSFRMQCAAAIAAVVANAVIAVTGAIVRVTGSGLGCPTWPQCFPGSMTPIAHPEYGQLHQWIEYSNRLLSALVGIVAAWCVISAVLAKPRRRRVVLLSLTLVAGVIAQAVIGGISVRMELTWWVVALHLLPSPVLLWCAVLLLHAIKEGDEPARARTHAAIPKMLLAQTVVLAALLVAGTMVTGAGPHAGDADVPRLDLPVDTLAHVHAAFMFIFLGMLIGVGFLLRLGSPGAAPDPRVWRRYLVLLVTVLAQGLLGFIQYWTKVPETLVVLHVLGAMLVTAATAALWCATRDRGPRPVATEPATTDRPTPAPVGV